MSELNNITPQQNKNTPWTKKQILLQNAVGSAIAAPISIACYDMFCNYREQENLKIKERIKQIAKDSREGIAKLLDKIGLSQLSKSYAKVGNKTALAVELGLHFLTYFSFFSLMRGFSNKDSD